MQLTDIRSCLISVQNELLLSSFNITLLWINVMLNLTAKQRNPSQWLQNIVSNTL